MAKHFRRLTIVDIREETPECVSVSFDIPKEYAEEFRFRAGQNITLRTHIKGVDVRRSYSICSSPGEHELRIAIKKVEEGLFSNHAHQYFKKNDVLEVMPPTGNFVLSFHPENKKHYIAFAAGSGITPVISLLKTILQEEPLSRFTLIYGNRNRTTVIFREELLSLKNDFPERFQLVCMFSKEKMEAPLFEGRIDEKKCDILLNQIISPGRDQEYLLCGPAAMIFSVRDWLLAHDTSEKTIHYELFSDPNEKTTSIKRHHSAQNLLTGRKSNVSIRLDGITTNFEMPHEGPTILEAAIQQGADLPFACRAGVCATCRAKLIVGKIVMDQNYSLAEEEIEQNFILACQAHPATDSVEIDFDIR